MNDAQQKIIKAAETAAAKVEAARVAAEETSAAAAKVDATKIATAVKVATEKIEEAKAAALTVLEQVRDLASTLSPNIERIRELSTAPLSHIDRIRQISENLRDPDLAYRILDELPDGIILVDRAGVIQLVNKQTEALFGYTRYELDGSPLSLLLPVAKRETHEQMLAKYFTNPVKRPMMDTIKHGLTLTGLHKDGTEFALDISLTPLKTPNDVFVVAVTRRK